MEQVSVLVVPERGEEVSVAYGGETTFASEEGALECGNTPQT